MVGGSVVVVAFVVVVVAGFGAGLVAGAAADAAVVVDAGAVDVVDSGAWVVVDDSCGRVDWLPAVRRAEDSPRPPFIAKPIPRLTTATAA